MKRLAFILAALLCSSVALGAQQEKKPTLMVLPSDHWCATRYFVRKIDNQGKTVIVNNYEDAFRQDNELPGVAAKVSELLIGYGYPTKDYVQEAKAINDRHAEDEVTMSSGGGMLEESPLDIIRRTVKYDVEIAVDWQAVSDNEVQFIIDAVDTYTSKHIATVSNITRSSKSAPIEVQLESALKKQLSAFSKQLDSYFKELQEKGREIRLTVRVWDNSEYNLESEVQDAELLEVIEDWLDKNTVNKAYNLSSATENRADFEQVRIPFFNEKGRPMDARAFGAQLRRYLSKPPYAIDSKVMMRGLGEVIIVIGDK